MVTIEEALQVYMQQLRANGRSEHTRRQYERHVHWLIEWGRSEGMNDVDRVTSSDLARFLCSDEACRRRDGSPKKQSTLNAMRSSLRTFFQFLHAAGYVSEDSARLIALAHCEPPPPKALTDGEVDRLLSVIEEDCSYEGRRDRALVRLLLAVGLRIGAALSLKGSDLCMDTSTISVRRGKRGRQDRFHVPEDVLEDLAEVLEAHDGDYVFAKRDGNPLSARHVQRRFEVLSDAADLQLGTSLHSLRHTFATRLLRATNDIALVQSAMGHRSVTSTLVYARIGSCRIRDEIDRQWTAGRRGRS